VVGGPVGAVGCDVRAGGVCGADDSGCVARADCSAGAAVVVAGVAVADAGADPRAVRGAAAGSAAVFVEVTGEVSSRITADNPTNPMAIAMTPHRILLIRDPPRSGSGCG
jgi:hypothetical protein